MYDLRQLRLRVASVGRKRPRKPDQDGSGFDDVIEMLARGINSWMVLLRVPFHGGGVPRL